MAVVFVPSGCDFLSKSFVVSCGLRSPSTKGRVYKGCKGTSFHTYHTVVILDHLLLLMLPIELVDAGRLIGRCVWMEYTNVKKCAFKCTPKSSRRDIRTGSVAMGSFNFPIVDWNYLRFDYNVMADFSLKLGIQVTDIIMPHKHISPLLADEGVVIAVLLTTPTKVRHVWNSPAIPQR